MKKEIYIERCKKVHNNKYEYVIEEDVDLALPITAICPIHGKFKQSSKHHLYRKSGCEECKFDAFRKVMNNKRISQKEVLKRLNKIHNSKQETYRYDKFVYSGNHEKSSVFCIKCQKYFEIAAGSHLLGIGCCKCGHAKRSRNMLNKSKQKKINKLKANFPELTFDANTINGLYEKVTCFCKIHGKFEKRLADMLDKNKNYGCKKCSWEILGTKRRKSTDNFVKEIKKLYPGLYGFKKCEYKGAEETVMLLCKKHNKYFKTIPANLLHRFKFPVGCMECKNHPQGELLISKKLKDLHISFKQQYSFKTCKNINPLPFDFYLPDFNIAIEYQGEQHYYPVKWFGGWNGYFKGYERDIIKHNYCIKKGIRLVEIPYWEKNNIPKIIENVINTSK